MITVSPTRVRPSGGTTLVEIGIALSLLGILLAIAVPAGSTLDHWSLTRATRLAERHLVAARLHAVAHRRPLRVRVSQSRFVETVDATGQIVARIDLGGSGMRSLDSIRIRPPTIRYNPRGHGSAGSLYLYRGNRGVRLISNFVGRVRRHSFRF